MCYGSQRSGACLVTTGDHGYYAMVVLEDSNIAQAQAQA